MVRFINTAWCDHPRKVVRPLLTNKQCIVKNLQIVIPEVDDDGTLASWGFHALDTSFWNKLLRTLKHPGNDPPESPPKTSFPQTNSSPPASPQEPTPPKPQNPKVLEKHFDELYEYICVNGLVIILLLHLRCVVSHERLSKVLELMLMLSNEIYLLRRHLFLRILFHNAVAHRCWLPTIGLNLLSTLLWTE